MKESENTQGKSSAIPSIDGLGARREVGKWLNELYDQPVNKFDIANLCAAYDQQEAQIERLRRSLEAMDARYKRCYSELLKIYEVAGCGWANVLRHPITHEDTMLLRDIKFMAMELMGEQLPTTDEETKI